MQKHQARREAANRFETNRETLIDPNVESGIFADTGLVGLTEIDLPQKDIQAALCANRSVASSSGAMRSPYFDPLFVNAHGMSND
jgi:hypothetical protein